MPNGFESFPGPKDIFWAYCDKPRYLEYDNHLTFAEGHLHEIRKEVTRVRKLMKKTKVPITLERHEAELRRTLATRAMLIGKVAKFKGVLKKMRDNAYKNMRKDRSLQ